MSKRNEFPENGRGDVDLINERLKMLAETTEIVKKAKQKKEKKEGANIEINENTEQ